MTSLKRVLHFVQHDKASYLAKARRDDGSGIMADEVKKAEFSLHLDEIGQIALTVSDLDRSTAFYRDVLGMTLLFDAGTMVFFQCGSVRFMIGTAEGEAPDFSAPSRVLLYFKVADLAAMREALGKAGVEFVEEPHLVARMADHDLWMASFKDPDGNVLMLMSEVAWGGESRSA